MTVFLNDTKLGLVLQTGLPNNYVYNSVISEIFDTAFAWIIF
jgi:hypothetical protein